MKVEQHLKCNDQSFLHGLLPINISFHDTAASPHNGAQRSSQGIVRHLSSSMAAANRTCWKEKKLVDGRLLCKMQTNVKFRVFNLFLQSFTEESETLLTFVTIEMLCMKEKKMQLHVEEVGSCAQNISQTGDLALENTFQL